MESVISTVILGGAGFIGESLFRSLLSRGIHTHIVDFNQARLNRFKEINNDRLKFHEFDCSITSNLQNFFNENPELEVVYHLAANSDISKSVKNPKPDFDNTLKTTIAL